VRAGRVDRQAEHFRDRAVAHQLLHLRRRDEAVLEQRTLRPDIADPDERDIGLRGQRFDDPVQPVIAPLRALGLAVG
jgi:hypothetical protein